MKPSLLFPRNQELGEQPMEIPSKETATRDIVIIAPEEVKEDLGLETVLDAMAHGDAFLRDVAERTLMEVLQDESIIGYRQEILRDFLRVPDLLVKIYQLATATLEADQQLWPAWGRSSESLLRHAISSLEITTEAVGELRELMIANENTLVSRGLLDFGKMLQEEASEDYLARVKQYLGQLEFKGGVLLGARLGVGNKGRDYVALAPAPKPSDSKDRAHRSRTKSILSRVGLGERSWYSFTVPAQDESGARALSELTNAGLEGLARTMSASSSHVLEFFKSLREQAGFYVGCLNLARELQVVGQPLCFPTIVRKPRSTLSFQGLVDPGLWLSSVERVTPNDLSAEEKPVLIVTGANQGGKSTFLRSIGIALLMAHAGMYVAAESFSSSLARGIFTHFRREEDRSMTIGKFEEELERMRDIVGQVAPGSVLLSNESFASTYESEAAEIGWQVFSALAERGVRIVAVTHLHELAMRIKNDLGDESFFLRAERKETGERTFRILPGEPLATSFGPDLYQEVFGPPTE